MNNLVDDVLKDINSKFDIVHNQNNHITENDLDMIQDVLMELHSISLSQETIECIKKICIYSDENNNINNMQLRLSGAVPETPFIPYLRKHSYRYQKYDNNQNKNINNFNFNIFSFASNETQLSNLTQNNILNDEDCTQMTQMDIDIIDDGEDMNINGTQLSQSLIGLQLSQTQEMSLSPELTK